MSRRPHTRIFIFLHPSRPFSSKIRSLVRKLTFPQPCIIFLSSSCSPHRRDFLPPHPIPLLHSLVFRNPIFYFTAVCQPLFTSRKTLLLIPLGAFSSSLFSSFECVNMYTMLLHDMGSWAGGKREEWKRAREERREWRKLKFSSAGL